MQLYYPIHYSANNTSVRQLHNPTYDVNNVHVQPPTTAADPAHSRAVSVIITQEGESLPITGNLQLSTQEQQLGIARLPSNNQQVGVDHESETNIYHVLERPGDDADYEDLDAELDAEERAQAEGDQGENVYHILEGSTLETEEPEDTNKTTEGE